ncbi:MAG: hypothetical protein KKB50_08125 [Planctomycetes bacterium]|nr:hypothetical protein [Planctomycetota bacterium]
MKANLILAELARLSSAGIALMTLCIGLVLLLCAFCFWRILRKPQPSEQHHTPLDIDIHDTKS